MTKLQLLHDRALREGGCSRADSLGFEAYAQVLAAAVRQTAGPFTIGIFGEWGSGKTSLMGLIQERLKEDPNIFPVWMTAWRFEREQYPLIPILANILQELEESAQGRPEAENRGAKALVDWGESIRNLLKKLTIRGEVGLPFLGKISCELAGAKGPPAPESPLKKEAGIYYSAFAELNKLRLPAPMKIVILMDDLDRSFPDLALKILETIKLILWQPGFVFILGVSRRVITAYLQRLYESFGLQDFDGAQYLDKIIQLPFYLPPTSNKERINNFVASLLTEIDPEYKNVLQGIQDFIGPFCAHNPRTIIRFINNLIINKNIGDLILNDNNKTVPIGFYAVSEILQRRHSSTFHLLYNNDLLSESLAVLWGRDNNGTERFLKEDLKEPKRQVPGFSKIERDLTDSPELKELLLATDMGKEWLEKHEYRKHATELYLSRLIITGQEVPLVIETWRAPGRDKEFKCKMYRVNAFIDAKEDILDLIDEVTYYLHGSYPNPVRAVADRSSRFKLKELAWGPSKLRAAVKLKHQEEPIWVEGEIILLDRSKPGTPPLPAEVLANAQLN